MLVLFVLRTLQYIASYVLRVSYGQKEIDSAEVVIQCVIALLDLNDQLTSECEWYYHISVSCCSLTNIVVCFIDEQNSRTGFRQDAVQCIIRPCML